MREGNKKRLAKKSLRKASSRLMGNLRAKVAYKQSSILGRNILDLVPLLPSILGWSGEESVTST